MPIISTFFGIIIRMYYHEHEPAHFHAEYQGEQATFTLDGELLAGTFSSRTARRLIRDWVARHQTELRANWARIQSGDPLDRIPPLE